jgi:predicted RNase H-like HicB family nuclease
MKRDIQVRAESQGIRLHEFYKTLLAARQDSEKLKANKGSEGLTIETELEEESGRWIAEVVELAGVLVYGQTAEDAINKAKVLALRVLAERLEHGDRGGLHERPAHGSSHHPYHWHWMLSAVLPLNEPPILSKALGPKIMPLGFSRNRLAVPLARSNPSMFETDPPVTRLMMF